MSPITAITAYSKAQATYVMDRLHDVFKLDGSGRCEEYSNWMVRERILVGSA